MLAAYLSTRDGLYTPFQFPVVYLGVVYCCVYLGVVCCEHYLSWFVCLLFFGGDVVANIIFSVCEDT